MTIRSVLAVVLVFLTFSYAYAQNEKMFLDWNEPGNTGHTWTGWTWLNDASGFGEKGWVEGDCDPNIVECRPRTHEKTDYQNISDADISSAYKAPSTDTGSGLKIFSTNGPNQPSWWWLYGNNFGSYGLADANTDRFGFYLYLNRINDPNLDSDDPDSTNFEIGTYLCWPGGVSGESCPKEAAGHHYYHQFTTSAGTWLHVLLDRHPSHKRGVQVQPHDNPADPKNYFQYMNTFYMEYSWEQAAPSYYIIDEMKFSQTDQAENDESVTTLWVGYWPSKDNWEIGWMDPSFYGSYGNSSNSTFEVRWSTSPITNTNFDSATIIEPEFHELGTTNRVRRPNPWTLPTWTRFKLPDDIEATAPVIYFAVKDVSSTANGDGHNAPSPYVKTIDYNLKAGETPPGVPLSIPQNFEKSD